LKYLNGFLKKKYIVLPIKYEEVQDQFAPIFAEAYRRRKYIAHFLSKLTDSDSENSETQVWIDFAFACKYNSAEEYLSLSTKNAEVGKILGSMIQNPEKFIN
jgi:four helix bundle protein